MKAARNMDETLIYQTKNGAIALKQDTSSDMLWASQAHIADIFEVKRPAITKHISNILKNKELDSNSVCSKMEHTANDGKTNEKFLTTRFEKISKWMYEAIGIEIIQNTE